MPGRSTAPWARRKRLRKRRRVYLRRAFASTPQRVLRPAALRHSKQRAWIAEQLRAHHAGMLLRLRLTQASAATPRVNASRWLTGFAFEYARLVPFRARISIDTTRTFVIHTYDRRRRCVVCGDMHDQSLVIESPHDVVSFPQVHGVPYVFEETFVRATLRDGSIAIGVLSLEHTKHLRSDVLSVSHADTVGHAATLVYYDTANVLCLLSLHSVIRIDRLCREPFSAICRDGYALSVSVCGGEAWPLGRVVGTRSAHNKREVGRKRISVWHTPRSSSQGLWSADDRLVLTFVDGRGMRNLVKQHGGVSYGALPTVS